MPFWRTGQPTAGRPWLAGCKLRKAWGWGKGTCRVHAGAWPLWEASFVELAEVTISEKASGGHTWRLKEPQAQIWDVTESLKPSWQRCLLLRGKRIHFHILLPWTPLDVYTSLGEVICFWLEAPNQASDGWTWRMLWVRSVCGVWVGG